MEVVEFGKEDMFCNTLTSWTVTDSNTGETIGGGHMRQWRDDLEWGVPIVLSTDLLANFAR